MVAAKANPDGQVDIAMVGKYVQVKDSYISLNEALTHAGVKTRTRVNVHYIESTDIEKHGTHALSGMDAILVPGGFGERGIEGKIAAVRFARENKIPYLGICLGMQLASIEFGRHVLGLDNANSTEFNRASPHPVIALITEWQDAAKGEQKRDDATGKGGTMRLGSQEVNVDAEHAGAFDLRQRDRVRAASSSLRIQQRLPRSLHAGGIPVLGPVQGRPGRDHRTTRTSVVRRDPVPPRVHLHAARRASVVHRFRARRAPASQRPAAGSGERLIVARRARACAITAYLIVLASCPPAALQAASPANSTVIPIRLSGNFALVEVRIGGRDMPLLLDTGDSRGILLAQPVIDRIKAKSVGQSSKVIDLKGNIVESPQFEIPRLQIGSIEFANVIADLDVHDPSYQPDHHGQQGFLGTALLKPYQVVIDYSRLTVTLIAPGSSRARAGDCRGVAVPFVEQWRGEPVTEAETELGRVVLWWDTGSPLSILTTRFAQQARPKITRGADAL